MSLAEELPVYKASYDLVLSIFNLAKNFNKDFKYTLGESLKNEAVKAVTNILLGPKYLVRFCRFKSYHPYSFLLFGSPNNI